MPKIALKNLNSKKRMERKKIRSQLPARLLQISDFLEKV
jgi:hypothetical protein